ncbi:hypothetical protein G9A89_017730 [Geosiphon pyriformis]|nr:hypothetical protein G9A89_017730 [Geosiphon pyriformis]
MEGGGPEAPRRSAALPALPPYSPSTPPPVPSSPRTLRTGGAGGGGGGDHTPVGSVYGGSEAPSNLPPATQRDLSPLPPQRGGGWGE